MFCVGVGSLRANQKNSGANGLRRENKRSRPSNKRPVEPMRNKIPAGVSVGAVVAAIYRHEGPARAYRFARSCGQDELAKKIQWGQFYMPPKECSNALRWARNQRLVRPDTHAEVARRARARRERMLAREKKRAAA